MKKVWDWNRPAEVLETWRGLDIKFPMEIDTCKGAKTIWDVLLNALKKRRPTTPLPRDLAWEICPTLPRGQTEKDGML